MKINEINNNNRLEINYLENGKLYNYKGIVVLITEEFIYFLTDLCEEFILNKKNIISVEKNNFDKTTSNILTEAKNYYLELYELEEKVKELKSGKINYIEKMKEVKLINNFSIDGFKNYLNEYFKTFNLNIDNSTFYLYFSEDNDILYLNIIEERLFDYLHVDNFEELIEIQNSYAKTRIKEIKLPYSLLEIDRNVSIHSDGIYKSKRIFQAEIDLNKDDFLSIRENINNIIK